ncbi:hypothetical protein FB451DRAFT_1173830 [Mycena latifolia]|nr:hypothetical protein FB451DRAFT_1173830 [Mycena latifolia]
MALSVPGSLWRAGSSMSVYIFRASNIAAYRPLARDRILLSILTSPKHGPLATESLERVKGEPSKDPWACIIGRPGEGVTEFGMTYLPGPSWADAGEHDTLGKWDVVCRVAQLRTNESAPDSDRLIQWTGDSSEVLSAVAHAAVSSASAMDPIISPSHVSQLVREALDASKTDISESLDSPVYIPVRILLAHAERIVVVHVPVDHSTMAVYFPLETSYDRYRTKYNDAFIPRVRAAVEPEIALELNQLPTGHVLDTISLPSQDSVGVSIVQPLEGSVTVLVDQNTIFLPREERDGLTTYLPDFYDQQYPQLASILIDVRDRVLSTFSAVSALTSAPAICLVGPMQHDGYDTIDDHYLSLLPSRFGLEGSVAYQMWIESQARGCGGGRAQQVHEYLHGEVVRLWAAHPSGVLAAQATFSDTDMGRRASFARLTKTPFELVRGEFFFPRTIAVVEEDDELDYEYDEMN